MGERISGKRFVIAFFETRAAAVTLLGGVMPPRSHFLDEGSELTTDDISRIGAGSEAGHAAVAILEERALAQRSVVRQAGTMPPLAS